MYINLQKGLHTSIYILPNMAYLYGIISVKFLDTILEKLSVLKKKLGTSGLKYLMYMFGSMPAWERKFI
jgi:hypothetical protein